MQHGHVHHHVDIEEEPGTYRSNWACLGAMAIALFGLYNGLDITKTNATLGAATMVVAAAVIVLNAARLFTGAGRWASQLTIVLGIWSWYSAHLLGTDPNIFELGLLGMCWSLIFTGLGYVFLGTWSTLGAPSRVEWEPFWNKTES